MNTQRLAQLSQRMSLITLLLIVTMLLLNAAVWWFPVLSSSADGLGFGFALSDRQIQGRAAQVALFPVWQTLGGILLSSVPLLALASGLNQLRKLFQSYARGRVFFQRGGVALGQGR